MFFFVHSHFSLNVITAVYSIIKHLGKCSRRYANSSCEAPGQFVSSSSCKWRNWMMLDNPLDVSNGHPARDKTCKFLIEQRCCNPKSRICAHHRRKSALREIMVDIYPTPMSVICTHLKIIAGWERKYRLVEINLIYICGWCENSIKIFLRIRMWNFHPGQGIISSK